MLEHPTIAGAAEAAGLGERTLYRYLNEPAFKAELRRRQNEIVSQTVAAVIGSREKVLETLREALKAETSSWSEKIRAAHYLWGHSDTAIELDVLIERIERLEALAKGEEGAEDE